jgi:hypothetical protein
MPTADESLAHNFLAPTVVIFPGVVHKSDAFIESFLDYCDRFTFRLHQSKVVTTNGNCRH